MFYKIQTQLSQFNHTEVCMCKQLLRDPQGPLKISKDNVSLFCIYKNRSLFQCYINYLNCLTSLAICFTSVKQEVNLDETKARQLAYEIITQRDFRLSEVGHCMHSRGLRATQPCLPPPLFQAMSTEQPLTVGTLFDLGLKVDFSF